MQDDKKRLKLAEEALTPDEEHKIEVRVDKMMQFEADKKSKKAAKSEADTTESDESTKPVVTTAPDVPAEATEPSSEELAVAVPEAEEAVAEPEETVEVPPVVTAEETDAITTAPEEATAEVPADKPEAEPVAPPVDEIAALSAEPDVEPVEAGKAKEDAPATSSTHDEAYDSEAAEIAAAFTKDTPKPHRNLLNWLRHSKKARWGLGIFGVILLIALAVLPMSRAWALNLAGMRGQLTVTILDATTQLPLKDVNVTVGGAAGKSDVRGFVTLPKVKLGKQLLVAQKSAFTTQRKSVNVSYGENTVGKLILSADGTQFQLKVIDFVTGKPIIKAQASTGQATAVADAQGVVTLTVPAKGDSNHEVTVTADGYRDQTLHADAKSSAVTSVQLVLVRPDIYFSNQSGKYDLYKSDIDGKHSSVLLKATGTENSDLALLAHPTADEVAIVDTRDNNRDSGGYLLQTLTLVNVTTGAPTTIDHSERIVLVDWMGDRLVYVVAKAGASAASTSRYQLMSYDFRTNQRLELDHANAFNDVVSAGGAIYYAVSNQYNGGTSQFVSQHADGTAKQVLLNAEVWNILRKDYANFYLSTSLDSYTYQIGNGKPTITKDGFSGNNTLFVDSPDGKHSLWTEQRDGKSTLLVHDNAKQTDSVLVAQAGATNPVRWLTNDTVIYRVSTPSETADYVIGLGSNTAKKITDLTAATGRALWYYY